MKPTVEKIKIHDWSNLERGYFFATAEGGKKVFVHYKNFNDPLMGKIMIRRYPDYNLDKPGLVREILPIEYLKKEYSVLYAIIEEGPKGLLATHICVEEKQIIKLIKNRFYVSQFDENCEIIKKVQRQLDQDRWSRMMN